MVRFGVRLVRFWSAPQRSLNDPKIRNLKPSFKPVKLSDSHGLYLLANPGGSRIWYLKYRFNGKEPRVSLDAYPLVSLAGARQQRDGVHKLLAQNINPAQQRMADKAAASPEKCFKAVALAWHKTNKKWSSDSATRILASMKNHIFPAIGHLPVTTLKTQHFTALLRVIERKAFWKSRPEPGSSFATLCVTPFSRDTRRCIWKASPRRRLKITIPPCLWSGYLNCLNVLAINRFDIGYSHSFVFSILNHPIFRCVGN